MMSDGPSTSSSAPPDPLFRIQQELESIKTKTQECGLEIDKTRQMQEHHSINFYQHHQISVQLDGGQFQEHSQEYVRWKEWREKVAHELRQSFHSLKLQTSNLANHHLEMYKQLKNLQFLILEQELKKWIRDQQLSGNGAPFNAKFLDTIQKWCEDLAEFIWICRQQIERLEQIQQGLNIPRTEDMTMSLLHELGEGLGALLDSLIKSSFIIEQQPPQVLKTNTRFAATVRLLVGTKLHVTPPSVTVNIISEAQANALNGTAATKKAQSEYSSGEIVNNKQSMEYHHATGQLSVSFRNMSLKKIKRAEKKGTESVMDEKFALVFWSEFSIGNGKYCYQVCVSSLPVVVIVHGNQEPHALATVLWDNAFAEWDRAPFNVPDKVAWFQLAGTLDMKFKSACGRGLSEGNLTYLASKAFRQHSSYTQDFSVLMIGWGQFCKEPLPDRSFTFWDWFHAVMRLIKEDLRGLWMDGALLGFVSRQETEERLLHSEDGTFLVRFSDSELGGVTVAFVSTDETGNRGVAMLQPYTRKDLLIRSLADRIKDYSHLVYLYPATPKDQAFGKYYTQPPSEPPLRGRANGYVPHHLVNVIPSINRPTTADSLPGTPYYDHPHLDAHSPMAARSTSVPPGTTCDNERGTPMITYP